jgi:hypothetical protein
LNIETSAPTPSRTIDDELVAFIETRWKGERWDLIEGVMASPSLAHRRIGQNLCNLLMAAFAAGSRDLFAYIGIGVGERGVRDFQPGSDVVVFAGDSRGVG